MKLLLSMDDFPSSLRPCALSIGNFDGVHLGHQMLLERCRNWARQHSMSSGVLSFSPHPMKVLHPDRSMRELFPYQDTVEVLGSMDLDFLVVQNFDLDFARLSPVQFVDLLKEKLDVRHLVLGHDFRFGQDRCGDIPSLEEFGRSRGFSVEIVPPVEVGGKRVSSSRIRKHLSSGLVEEIPALLGRPFELRGSIVGGDRRGRRLGFPTANLMPENESLPKVGVYFTEALVGGELHAGLTNVGYRPTFEKESGSQTLQLSVETYLLHFQGQIYGSEMRVRFLKRLRPELKFNSSDELIDQIGKDIKAAEAFFGSKNKMG